MDKRLVLMILVVVGISVARGCVTEDKDQSDEKIFRFPTPLATTGFVDSGEVTLIGGKPVGENGASGSVTIIAGFTTAQVETCVRCGRDLRERGNHKIVGGECPTCGSFICNGNRCSTTVVGPAFRPVFTGCVKCLIETLDDYAKIKASAIPLPPEPGNTFCDDGVFIRIFWLQLATSRDKSTPKIVGSPK